MKRPTEDQVANLADAMVMVMNDMASGGNCVCDLVKAHARVAVEPFLLDDYGDLPNLEWAQATIKNHE